MKMKTHKPKSELKSRSEQLSTANSNPAEAQSAKPEKKDNRLPIEAEARKQNRNFPTPKVLNLLLTGLPDVYRLAEVVGNWVWVRHGARFIGAPFLLRS